MSMEKNNLAENIDQIFNPRSIAIIGASENSGSFGYHFMKYIVDTGYSGDVYPVSQKKNEIMGIKAYADISEIPGDVDYVISCVNASQVLDLIKNSKSKNVKAVHLFTGRFSETGDSNAAELEQEIAREAKRQGIRLIGPNCMGLYNPKAKIVFNYELSLDSGSVGLISQSGGTAGEIARFASLYGISFSKGISFGNAIDLNECDYLEYFLWEKETRIIVMYIEGIRDGHRFIDILKRVTSEKPVIILKGGRSESGIKSVVSHTSSIAGSKIILDYALRQSGAIQVSNIEELLEVLQAFYYLPAITGNRVGVFGGGGGKSVLSADECEEGGLNVIDMPERINNFLEERCPILVNWLGNPVDLSILAGFDLPPSDLLLAMAKGSEFDLLIGNCTEDSPMDQDVWSLVVTMESDVYIEIKKTGLKPVVMVIANPGLGYGYVDNWRWMKILKLREKMIKSGIPIYSSPTRAANAISKLIGYYQGKMKKAE